MAYKVIANFTDKGHPYQVGEVYEKVNEANADLMVEVKEEVNAKPQNQTVMSKESIKQK